MLRAEIISGNTLRLMLSGELTADDFAKVTREVSGFRGWKDLKAFERHVGFVKDHQRKIDRVAAIVAHKWQLWLAGTFRLLLHPEVRAYDKAQENKALEWLAEAEKVAAQ